MPLRVVHLEDDPHDRELVEFALRSEQIDCDIVPVSCRSAFEAAIEQRPDLILADYSLPGFDGERAQALAHARWPDVPFVFVSGSIGEEKAVERLKSGATDYVFKHHLEKLSTAIRRALREAEERHARARAEEALRRLNLELETRVKERTRELQETNEALRLAREDAVRANQAKSDFLSRMSHDLRTPLNAILGFAQLLLLDTLDEDQVDNATQILHAGEHLLQLINEVLDLSRIEAGRLSLSPEPVAVADVLQRSVELIAPLAARRRITVAIDAAPDLTVQADRQRLNQILLNLLSNAVKYNREEGRIRVTARPGDNGRIAIQVEDTGAGIPKEKLALLFTPFERLGAEQSRIEGTGLGLALAKALSEAMDGTLSVRSEVDHGTAFRVDLPRGREAVAVRRAAAVPAVSTAEYGGRILYVEDNLQNVHLMKRLLTRRPNVDLVHAIDGRTALALVREQRPDLVFLDLHLSDIHGEEVLRHIWEDPDTRSIPVVVLSADATSHQQRRLQAAGAVDYLTKPFHVSDVLQLIDRVLGTPR